MTVNQGEGRNKVQTAHLQLLQYVLPLLVRQPAAPRQLDRLRRRGRALLLEAPRQRRRARWQHRAAATWRGPVGLQAQVPVQERGRGGTAGGAHGGGFEVWAVAIACGNRLLLQLGLGEVAELSDLVRGHLTGRAAASKNVPSSQRAAAYERRRILV